MFLDDTLKDKYSEYNTYSNLTVVYFSWNELPLNKYISGNNVSKLNFPSDNNNAKNTLDFHILMNSKLFFLKEGLKYTQANTLIWIDYGIFKISNDTDHFKRNFSQLRNYNNILIPGGRFEKCYFEGDKLLTLYWRFLGGLIVCPRPLVEVFYELHQKELHISMQQNIITFEVVYWCNIEYKYPQLIRYYFADHNKSMWGFYDKKVILNTMIKNEEKIINRCLKSASIICDALCITDTGSNDNTITETINAVKEIQTSNYRPARLYKIDWENFGLSRTKSYYNTMNFCDSIGWEKDCTYALLLDADMKLIISGNIDKEKLENGGYTIIQRNGLIEYYNTRLIKLDGSWKCIGVTHEYWSGPDIVKLNKDTIYIDDVNDGGCKSDKYERDFKLLSKGIEDEPENERYYFYLAQTIKDLGRYEDSIKMYKKRIEKGGWDEEVWYSHYMIAKLWLLLNNIVKAEEWANKAYNLRKSRPEPLYFLVKYFREKSLHHKAYHYYKLAKDIPPSNDLLFVETFIPQYALDYEYTILHYYLFGKYNLIDGLKASIQYINKTDNNIHNVMENMVFYLEPLCKIGKHKSLNLPKLGDYIPSSPSIIKQNNKYLINVRYVNYRMDNNNQYTMSKDGELSSDNDVITKNAVVYMDNEYNITSEVMFINDKITDVSHNNHHIKGIEDIRVYNYNDKVMYIGTSFEYSYCPRIRMVTGEYDYTKMCLINNKSLIPPVETNCEKNWIPIIHNNQIKYIYEWYPLSYGILNTDNKLIITTKYDTPRFFKTYRGSTIFVSYKDELYGITHGIMPSSPRRYFHQFLVLDKTTLKPKRYSVPFYFENLKIEYSVGFHIDENTEKGIILYSKQDKDASILTFNINDINNMMLNL